MTYMNPCKHLKYIEKITFTGNSDMWYGSLLLLLCMMGLGTDNTWGADPDERLPISIENSISTHTFTDENGTYDVNQIILWSEEQKYYDVPIDKFTSFLVEDTLSNSEKTSWSNLKNLMDDPGHYQRMQKANLDYPIIVDNRNRIIDGIHRLVKNIYMGLSKVKCIFIDSKTLEKFRIHPREVFSSTTIIENMPIQDQLVKISKKQLPNDPEKLQEILEEYFVEHLPTPENLGDSTDFLDIRLERPSSPYGCYEFDTKIRDGLEWWGSGTRIRDIPILYQIMPKGIFALEDQWSVLSWSKAFQRMKEMPEDLVVLHIDDHEDMMFARVGVRGDNQLFDLLTNNHISITDPDSIKSAILSGAIGKASILTLLAWQVPRIHIRHLSLRFRTQGEVPLYQDYKLCRSLEEDSVLYPGSYHIALQKNFLNEQHPPITYESSYRITSNPNIWLQDLPNDIPIFLHIDMDFFNNRYDGDSSWQSHKRIHDPSLEGQKELSKEIFDALYDANLKTRVKDVSICISPSFFPAEYWEAMAEKIKEGLKFCEYEDVDW